jgi:alkanesulfonate monooxygenase SsuD/methylene tetrahydromethanopterin reductase-like flavin-dependent oxidoreductase (luciferase family)
MKFAIYVPNFDTFGDAQTVVELAQAAEAAGWDGFFLWDHLLPDSDSKEGPVADTWIALSSIATATHRLRLGA